jgi:hypothetical protein
VLLNFEMCHIFTGKSAEYERKLCVLYGYKKTAGHFLMSCGGRPKADACEFFLLRKAQDRIDYTGDNINNARKSCQGKNILETMQ